MHESVNVIIFTPERDQVLLVKRRDIPVWVLPGGGIDQGESPETAALREGEEETGYQVAILRKVAEYLPVNKMTKLTHVYECQIVGGHSHSNAEVSDVAFFPVHHLPKLLSPPYAMWIQEAYEGRPFFKKKIQGISYWVLIKLLIQHPVLVGRYLLTKLGIHLN